MCLNDYWKYLDRIIWTTDKINGLVTDQLGYTNLRDIHIYVLDEKRV